MQVEPESNDARASTSQADTHEPIAAMTLLLHPAPKQHHFVFDMGPGFKDTNQNHNEYVVI